MLIVICTHFILIVEKIFMEAVAFLMKPRGMLWLMVRLGVGCRGLACGEPGSPVPHLSISHEQKLVIALGLLFQVPHRFAQSWVHIFI